MKGDFSRDTFRQTATVIADATTPTRDRALRRRHYARVLQQQGRVQLDSDWNEQVAIQTYLLRTFAADVIGRHGAPASLGAGFMIEAVNSGVLLNPPAGVSPTDLVISPGRYYVEGIACECPEAILFTDQPDRLDAKPLTPGSWLIFLDVWERHLTSIEDPYIREVALGGPDTATRAQAVWQVFAMSISSNVYVTLVPSSSNTKAQVQAAAMNIVDGFDRPQLPLMRARSQPKVPDEPCLLSPDAQYRGPENQLYRVEVHWPSPISAAGTQPAPGPTFKWSRDNGSVVYPIVVEAVATAPTTPGTTVVVLEHLGKDDRSRLKVGDWVEFVDDSIALGSRDPGLPITVPPSPVPSVMRQVRSIEDRRVTLSDSVPLDQTRDLHALLRRWETQDVAIPAPKPSPDNAKMMVTDWIPLEDGVEIQFCVNTGLGKLPQTATFRTGDYWIVPARVATGDVEWPGPGPNGQPDFAPPRGVEHAYAPLAAINVSTANTLTMTDLRMVFGPLAQPV